MRPTVRRGPWLLSAPDNSLAAHRAAFGPIPALTSAELEALVSRTGVLGRGGAGFPFARKLSTAQERRALRRHVVINLSEGEPASAKDAALILIAPHLVLDGAVLTARALGTRQIDVVVPGELSWVERGVLAALRERAAAGEDRRLRWTVHHAAARFVSGEASAVTELIDGRANLPVTSWVPTAVRGVQGRPTLLSNGETFAQVSALALAGDRVPGTAEEPGTRLLSITRGEQLEVLEVAHGTLWSAVLSEAELQQPVLVGGYHGQWAAAGALRGAEVTSASMRSLGLSLGAGVVLPLPERTCPLTFTSRIVRYLARESAGRCGPCFNGLPALAEAFEGVVNGRSGPAPESIAALVRGRGACSHPDGTARLVVSACTTFADELRAHEAGGCLVTAPRKLRSA